MRHDTIARIVLIPQPPLGLGLAVKCDWCSNIIVGGCIVCHTLYQNADELANCPDWQSWRQAMLDDHDACGACSDWLEENGMPRLAVQLRQLWLYGEKPTKQAVS
jgi:hypothetical protein